MLEIKKGLIIGIIIFSISMGVVLFLILGSDSQSQSTSKDSIDLSFDNWVISGGGISKYIEDKGEYIEIYDNKYGSYIQAQLDFESLINGSFKVQVRTPDLLKDGMFYFLLNSGADIVFTIERYKTTGVWYFICSGNEAFFLILPEDTDWHSIEVFFEINGENSIVSIKVDGITKIVAMNFSTTGLFINKIICQTTSIHIPTLTHIKFESLTKLN